MRNRSLLIIVAGLVAAAACSDGDETPQGEATFDAVMERVVTPNCTFSSCHANPTVAAALDLTPELACDTLVNTPSCLFPDRMRIVPGSPDDSFFFHKLTGQSLDQAPNSACAQSNLIMPFGGTALPDDELALVRDWIAAGASCESNPDKKPPPDAPPEIAGLSVSRNAPIAGESVTFTVTLSKPAPDNGQMIELLADPTAISAPVQVVVPPAAAVVRFEAYAMRPTARFTLRAVAGQSSREVVLRIGGLDIAEVLADPTGIDDGKQWIKIYNRTPLPIDLSGYELRAGQTSYDTTKVPLVGSLSPGACAVIGGPRQTTATEPVYAQAVNFVPDLPHPFVGAAGFGVFDRLAVPMDGISTPVDTMIVGSNNDAGFRGPDGELPNPFCSTPASSLSALRTGPGSCVQAAMQPSLCP